MDQEISGEERRSITLEDKIMFVLGIPEPCGYSGVYLLYSALQKENLQRETIFDRIRVAYQN